MHMTAKTPHRNAKPAVTRISGKQPVAEPKRAARGRRASKRPARGQRQTTTTSSALPEPAGMTASKQARLIALLQSQPGATIAQMRALTGWQAHTVRGAISGALRKRLGLNVVCNAPGADGARIYRIVAARTTA